MLENHQKRQVFGKGIWGKFYAYASNRNICTNEIEAMTPDVVLEDGMSLSQYGIDGQIVKLAGHTRGSIGVRLSSGELPCRISLFRRLHGVMRTMSSREKAWR